MLSGVSVLSDDPPAPMPAPDASDSPLATDARCHSVHIRFAPSQGRRLTCPTSVPDDRPLWAERPVLMERADGSYDLIGTTTRLDALARWVLSHGTAATVTGPDRLRRRVAEEARRVAERYEGAENDEELR